MKVIDLLNRIANGEEVPKKFIVDGDTLYIGEDKFIEHANGERIEWFIYPSWLNEEVEIIEEDIRELQNKLQQKENIIKEAREYIEKYETIYGYFNDNNFNGEYIEDEIKNNILEILDKGEK